VSVLVAYPERSIIENELAKKAGMSVSEANRQKKDLVNVGLVAMERVGKSKVYQVDQRHFLYAPLKSVFRSLEEIYREIANKVARFVTRKHKVEAVVPFGSLALRKVRSDFVKEPSDVDVVIIVKDESQIKSTRNNVSDFVGSKFFLCMGSMSIS